MVKLTIKNPDFYSKTYHLNVDNSMGGCSVSMSRLLTYSNVQIGLRYIIDRGLQEREHGVRYIFKLADENERNQSL